jgi:general transcription factor 3C polypeptide 3 (transcription factor C subunit 4)
LEVPGAGFALLEILVLADLYNTLDEHERAVDVIRKGARWLQGRSEQNSHWDLCGDDREYDCESAAIVRAIEAVDDVEPGYYELDVNARHRLAIARIKMGDMEEGKVGFVLRPCFLPIMKYCQVHADVVLSQDILDYAPLFSEIADAYFEQELFAEARAIYELLAGNDTVRFDDLAPYIFNFEPRRAACIFCSKPQNVCG